MVYLCICLVTKHPHEKYSKDTQLCFYLYFRYRCQVPWYVLTVDPSYGGVHVLLVIARAFLMSYSSTSVRFRRAETAVAAVTIINDTLIVVRVARLEPSQANNLARHIGLRRFCFPFFPLACRPPYPVSSGVLRPA